MHQQQRTTLLAEVRRDIEVQEKELAELRRLESYLARGAKSSLSSPNSSHQPSLTPAPESNRFATSSIVEAAQSVLREIGPAHSLRAPEIVKAMTDGGFPGPQKDLKSFTNTVFSAMHRRSDVFGKRGRGQWTLVEFLKKGEAKEGEKA